MDTYTLTYTITVRSEGQAQEVAEKIRITLREQNMLGYFADWGVGVLKKETT